MRCLAALCLALALAAAANAGDDAPVALPKVTAGDRWVYRLADWYGQEGKAYEVKVTFASSRAIQAVSTLQATHAEIDTAWTPEWNAVTDLRGGSFYPDSGLLHFPLHPGLRYTSEFKVKRPRDGFFGTLKLNVEVVGWEQVSVPAGTFRALKIEAPGVADAPDNFGGSSTVRYVIWYVPEVRRWVRWQFDVRNPQGRTARHDTEELVEYHVQ
jgi:hypothetical protein